MTHKPQFTIVPPAGSEFHVTFFSPMIQPVDHDAAVIATYRTAADILEWNRQVGAAWNVFVDGESLAIIIDINSTRPADLHLAAAKCQVIAGTYGVPL